MIERVVQLVAEELDAPIHSIGADTQFASTEMDSLEFVVLMQSVAEAFWQIPEERWKYVNSPADIVRELEAVKAA